MCGIAGVCVRDGYPLQTAGKVWDMLQTMPYRGPDDAGIAVFGPNGSTVHLQPRTNFAERETAIAGRVVLGHLRLSIIDLSSQGHQPMGWDDGRYHITYNGEIYNYRELRDELKAAGCTFRTQSDTEVILAAYQHWGDQCLDRFNGMWGLAIYDRAVDELFLARDRFGVKPLYYAEFPWGWGFASELKALLPLLPGKPKLNREKLLHYFVTRGAYQTEDTCFSGLKQLPGGCFLRIGRLGSLKKRWYNLADRAHLPGTTPKVKLAAMEVLRLLEDAVRLRLRSDVPVGACLSGGLDSSAIVTLMGQLLNQTGGGPVRTFTFAAGRDGLDESAYADIVACNIGAESYSISPRPEILIDEIEKFVVAHDEPVSTLSIYSQWEVMRLAKEHGVTVLLDGQGGDESFLGYTTYYARRIWEMFRGLRWIAAVRELVRARRNSAASGHSLIATGIYAGCPSVRQWLRQRRARRLLHVSCHSDAGSIDREESDRNWRTDELTRSPLPHLLKYEDRNSMAFSVETRLPFLDYRLVEYVAKLPDDWLLRDGWSKWLLRQAVQGIVPRQVVERRDKLGFVAPSRDIQQAQQARIREFLLEPCPPIDGLLNRRRVEVLAADPARHDAESWLVLNAKTWARSFRVTD